MVYVNPENTKTCYVVICVQAIGYPGGTKPLNMNKYVLKTLPKKKIIFIKMYLKN